MKKLLFTLVLLLMPVVFIKANTISDITMDVYVDKYGDAIITETWEANVNQGTEGYHPYFNIGNSNIIMLSASMDGRNYTISNYWNVNASMVDKAYKAGIYKSGNETDICFGLTSYGRHTYEVKYKITNFVLSANDSDIVYWTLFPYDFNATPDRVYIKMHSDFKYEDTLDVWGYGNYGGTAYVYDGYIEMQSPENFNSNQYMTILVKFPKGSFETNNISDKDFNYYYNMAEDGANRYVNDSNDEESIFYIISIFITFSSIFLPIVLLVLVSGKKTNNDRYYFGPTGNKVRNDVPNYRDIPCNKDIYRAYFISEKYNLNKKKEDFLGAILLNWFKNGYVKVEKCEHKRLFKKDILDNIIFLNKPETNALESKLYDWMYTSSKDGKLEANEFEKWCSSNYNKILDWFDEVINYEKDELIKENKITVQTTNKKIFNETKYLVDPSMMEEAEQLAGLKKYLVEFSLIHEKEPMEVHLWNEYLIFAQIFGIAKEVASQFKKLYPEIIEEMDSSGLYYNNILFLNSISHKGMSSARSAYRDAQRRANSYSSGGGGFSSGGGGGGSFGGGGGGGGFR